MNGFSVSVPDLRSGGSILVIPVTSTSSVLCGIRVGSVWDPCGTGGSWSASAGPKERDDPGEGRRALGETLLKIPFAPSKYKMKATRPRHSAYLKASFDAV